MSEQSKDRMNAEALPVNGDALEGARRATEDASPFAPPNPEVASTAQRRQFSAAERARILNAADACNKPGEIGALMTIPTRRRTSRRSNIVLNSHRALAVSRTPVPTVRDSFLGTTTRIATLVLAT